MNVNTEKCIGCRKCVNDCLTRTIELVNGKAKIHNRNCVKCGHCIAICPMEAVSTDAYNMQEVKIYNKENFDIDSDNFLNSIKFRRTIRNFKDKKVEKEKIIKIIEAGRYTQTGGNSQDVSYTVIRDNIQHLKGLTIEGLKNVGKAILSEPNFETNPLKVYVNVWIKMYEEYQKNPKGDDRLFFNAPVLIVVTAASVVNGSLASGNMKIMAESLGLGAMFCGSVARAVQGNGKIRDFIGVKDGKEIVACMVIGYPNVRYLRTVPRKEAEIEWK